jgi:hypothetical protein
MFTPKTPEDETARDVGAERFRQASIIGGSADNEVTELAVIPKFWLPSAVVTTVTPLARWPTT